MSKKILFLTGTRADFGKLKTLMSSIEQSPKFELLIFVTGMHMQSRYGYTVEEVYKAGFQNVHTFMNQYPGEPMDITLANTIAGLSRYVHEHQPDLIVVHGDRVEAMAGAIVGALNNILVAHIEGGELSGTIDEVIRHSVSKLSHLHFVANEEAASRLKQLGESGHSIHVIGSPDIDVMLSDDLPTLEEAKARYEIEFENYGIVLFHPVTTERESIRDQADELVSALLDSEREHVVIYPNNDAGSEEILVAYKRLKDHPRFRLFPSLRFEHFLTLMKHADYLIGNSSAGIHEAPVYGVPTINIGTRQNGRFQHSSIVNVSSSKPEILAGIDRIAGQAVIAEPCYTFGDGDSAGRFLAALEEENLWQTAKQKQFQDLPVAAKS